MFGRTILISAIHGTPKHRSDVYTTSVWLAVSLSCFVTFTDSALCVIQSCHTYVLLTLSLNVFILLEHIRTYVCINDLNNAGQLINYFNRLNSKMMEFCHSI